MPSRSVTQRQDARTMQQSLRGTITAIVTPMSSDGSLDRQSLARLIESQLKAGVDGFVVCGSTGEAVTLSEREYQEMLVLVRESVPGDFFLIAGVGASATARAVELAGIAEGSGYSAALVVAPPYNKPPQSGLLAHFRAVHEAHPDLALVAYNIPGRTGVTIAPETLAQLAGEGAIVGLKDSTGSLEHLLETVRLAGPEFPIVSGEDGLVLPLMACGGRGVISASANVAPREFVALTSAFLSADYKRARECQLALLPLVRALFMESNPIPAKAALHLQGILATPVVRLPLTTAQPATVERLRSVLAALAAVEISTTDLAARSGDRR